MMYWHRATTITSQEYRLILSTFLKYICNIDVYALGTVGCANPVYTCANVEGELTVCWTKHTELNE